MADIASTAVGTGLTFWDRTAEYRKYIRNLGDNLTALETKKDELGGVYNDVNRLAETAEGEGWIRKHDAAGWLESVRALREEADTILADGKWIMGKNCLCGLCYRNCRSRYKQSKLAEAKEAALDTKLGQGRNFRVKDDVAYDPAGPILERSLEALRYKMDELRGVFETVKQRVKGEEDQHLVRTPEVRGWLERVKLVLEEEVGQILERGKLELDKSCKKEGADFHSRRNFTSISTSADKKRAIMEGLLGERRGFTELTCKPDDPLMVEIALQPPVGMNSMFEEKLGEKTWIAHPRIPEIANTLVGECKYLPLALVTVARAMAGTTDLEDWMIAEKDLKWQVDMEEEVLKKLEFSYNRLPDEIHKRCLLCLSIFPEDHGFYEDDAIALWIGEGFLDECDDVHEARTYGRKIYRKLRHACLVEFIAQTVLVGEFFKMHDFVREMCLWVYSEHGSKKKKVLVQEEVESFRMGDLKKWKDAERISLWRVKSSVYDTSLATISCSRLSTLIIRDTSLRKIPDELFLSVPCLRVLDLSDNEYLQELPGSIWKLINLRYLNLNIAGAETHEVPEEIKNLSNLVVLILSRNVLVPAELISNLSSVRLFYWSNTSRYWPTLSKKFCEIECLEALEMMQSMEEIDITLTSPEGVEKLLSCPKLPSRVRGLCLCRCNGLASFRISMPFMRRSGYFQSLYLYRCDFKEIEVGSGEYEGSYESPGRYSSYVESLAPKPASFASWDCFQSLRNVRIFHCTGLENVTSLIYHAPFLENLCIERCDSMEEVIVGDIEDNHVTSNRVFPLLASLRLDDLYNLERICRRALPFPALKEIKVRGCFELKELPLNCDSAKNSLQVIEGEQAWWEGLKWDDPASEQVFSTKFVRMEEKGFYEKATTKRTHFCSTTASTSVQSVSGHLVFCFPVFLCQESLSLCFVKALDWYKFLEFAFGPKVQQ
ncbi:hypothetical protein CRG98_012230 [Punica granatum]|uniref:NB-ARC domain-containing protein n=1 Tax=Punica granatum TaxID=22663 RepID=A0A2I0KGB3_PUNGR|nr:hypothetical protein CRG98_012230 [Punica granatum]